MIGGRGGRGRDEAHGSGISVGGNNNAPNQNVVGQNISHVHQSASVQGVVDFETVRSLLVSFRGEVERNEAVLDNAPVMHAMADSVDTALANPDAQAQVGALHGVVQALPGLVAGTVVQQGGEALAHALAGWLR